MGAALGHNDVSEAEYSATGATLVMALSREIRSSEVTCFWITPVYTSLGVINSPAERVKGSA